MTKMLNDRFAVEFLDGRVVEVTAIPYDYSLYSQTARKHGWGSSTEDPSGSLLFVTWAALRRTELVERQTYEEYRVKVASLEKLDQEPVDPTQPDPGTG
jgi:hypothetical protein